MNPLASDLDYILAHTKGLWEDLRGRRVFITGGTGFFGCWLLESFNWANERLSLGASVVVLTRNPDAFWTKVPHLAAVPWIRLHKGDVRSFDFPDGEFSHIVHAATESNASLNEEERLLMLDTVIQGTRRVLDFALHCQAKKLLFTSSGVVYGRQPSDLTHIPETYTGGPDTMDVRSAFGEGKRVAELLCAIYHHAYGIQTKVARCFAFVGPYVSLSSHLAIGNFIRNRLNGEPIEVNGDGTPYRAYLYAADLMVWLWTILIKGESCHPYNVGSDDDITIRKLAALVAAAAEPISEVRVRREAQPGEVPPRYVPSTARACSELGLNHGRPLTDAIRRTLDWYKAQSTRSTDSRKGR